MAGADVELSILAVGSGEGSPIPRGESGGFVTDSSGAIIITDYDARKLAKLASGSGGRFAPISIDDSDIDQLLPDTEAPQQAQLTEREFDQWREEGPLLILLLLPLAALLFRRGALACALPSSLALGTLLMLPPQQSQAFEWQDLWQRGDQQAQKMLREGEAEEAAKTFKNPQWRGTSNYRAGDFPAAEKDFSRDSEAEGHYNLGNSLTQQGRYDEAIAAYDQVLEQRPQFADAEYNREIAQKLKELLQQQQQQSQQGQQQSGEQQQQQSGDSQQQQGQSQEQQQSQQNNGSQSEQSSAEQQSPQQKEHDGEQQDRGEQEQQAAQQQGKEQEQRQGEQQQAGAEESPLDPETQQALDQWLRQVPDDPAGLMREKFKYESLQRRRAYRSGEWQPPENGATQRW